MSVTVPPPGAETWRDLEQRVAELEALIEEARRRARRRRRIYAAIALAALGAGAWAAFDIGGGGASSPRSAPGKPSDVAAAQAGTARWRSLRGPQGGDVFALAIDPADARIVYAGGWGNVFKSTDGGSSWRDAGDEPWTARPGGTLAEVSTLAIDPAHPETLYAGTERGIGKSVDGGRHWRMVDTGLFTGDTRLRWGREHTPSALLVDPNSPRTVYFRVEGGLFRTTNGGASWRFLRPPLGRRWGVVAAAVDPARPATVYVVGAAYRLGSRLYETTDGGESWRRITTSAPHSFSALVLTDSGGLLATDYSQPGVYRSSDGGTTWRPAGLDGETIDALTVDPGSGATYATTRGRAVFETTDGGGSWQPASASLAFGQIATDPNDPATSYATAGDGVLKSVDHGRTWAPADRGIVSRWITTLALAPGSPATLYASSWGSFFDSTDRGRSWRAQTTALGRASIVTLAVEPRRPRTLLAGTWDGLRESSDGGRHWRRVRTGFQAHVVSAVAIDPRHPRTVYVGACTGGCGGPGSFLKTVDGGATWRRITIGSYRDGAGRLRPGSAVQSLALDPHTGAVFAGTTRGGIFRSTDAGRSWHRVAIARWPARSHVGFAAAVVALAVDPLDPRNVYAAVRAGGILRSTDGGATWARANTGLTDLGISALAVDPHAPHVLFASTAVGVFRSTDGAQSWQPFDRGLRAGGVTAFAIAPDGGAVYAGTEGGGVVALRSTG